MKRAALLILWMLAATTGAMAQVGQYVDPRIGSVGLGRTFPGPCMPFGMAKPGPDCGVLPNAGWAPVPQAVTGFSQTHVSGTGGGQKYGNILIMPALCGDSLSAAMASHRPQPQRRVDEDIRLGYYATTFADGIKTEITTSQRCAFYQFHFPASSMGAALFVDATHFLGKDSIPNLRERQQLVGAEVELVGDREVRGYSRVRGGWNNGDAYTVYFWLRADRPFRTGTRTDGQTACLHFADTLLGVKVGLSYVSSLQARKNIDSIGFRDQLLRLQGAWESLLSRVSISGTEAQKHMFYTALYHTMLMPVDKSGENPKWTETPYYDDFYAIWDTYRTSSPLLTLLCPDRQTEMVNALLNIYTREGYLPDARSGDCNGRTQGGSNAEVVIADAMAKQLAGIDYHLALQAMLHDAEADPGDDHEKHGRGGLTDYRRLGYIPYGVPRAGNRTVEYAFNDFCIAQVARALGYDEIAENYTASSRNWENLFRADYEFDGMRGFIMPRDDSGRWLDSVPWGRSRVFYPVIPYTPVTKVAPWYLPWWDTFFYEATSQEYSLSIPHDVPRLIQLCGGAEAFRQRLDRFFAQGYYNVQNEPSFLTPCLYHWIGRPDLSTQRVHHIVTTHYSDQPDGLPGNDDSGAMSSWLAFHMMGLYPNAGFSYYLLNVPLLSEYTLTLANGRQLHAVRKGRGDGFHRVTLNGRELADARLEHADLMQGGELVFETVPTVSVPVQPQERPVAKALPTQWLTDDASHGDISYTLNRQFRTWPFSWQWTADTLTVLCKQTVYRIPRHVVDETASFCWLTPQQDDTVYHDVQGTFGFMSRRAFSEICTTGATVNDGITWRRIDETDDFVHVKADTDGTEMWISKTHDLPLVLEMRHNPLGIDWTLTPASRP